MAVELDPQLLEMLACPSPDHAPLRVGTRADPDAEALSCTSCGREYPVVDGVPVLLLDEAVLPDDPASSDAPARQVPSDVPAASPSQAATAPGGPAGGSSSGP